MVFSDDMRVYGPRKLVLYRYQVIANYHCALAHMKHLTGARDGETIGGVIGVCAMGQDGFGSRSVRS
jgi:hypothetical protein